MNTGVKAGLYALFVVFAGVFGYLAFSQYSRLMSQSGDKMPVPAADVPALKGQADASNSGYGKVLAFGVVFFCSIVGVGLLAGHDISNFVGARAVNLLYSEGGPPITDPNYEQAEQEWANGNFLEALRLLRDYLNRHPREQHVALRIAEIYEKDLHNYLAAALEYEEVLKQKLPAERWGWAAIHLCNLYFKLNQTDNAVALLKRIDAEYGQTAAAEKARKRLEQMGVSSSSAAAATPIETEETPPAEIISESPSSGPKLPPGFLPRKT